MAPIFRPLVFLALSIFFLTKSIDGRQNSVGHFLENNSTNFHNMLFNARYHFHRYHSYMFDYWQSIDFGQFFRQLSDNPGYNTSWSDEEILQNLQHDDETNSTISQIASMCGKLANASSEHISDQCFKDLDYMACALFDIVRDAKKFLKGDCDRLRNALSAQNCKEQLKNRLMKNLWPLQMLDSFGKLPAGLNMGNHMTLGRFRDCNDIVVPRKTHSGRPFEANYCRVTFRFPLPETAAQITRQCEGVDLINNDNMTCLPHENFARMKWGICVPYSCNSRNMTLLFRYLISPTKHFCNTTVACYEKPQYLTDVKFIIGCSILAPFIILVILGTLYDMIFVQPTLEMLPDEKYDVIRDGNNQEFEMNGHENRPGVVLRNGRTKAEFLDDQSKINKILYAFSAYTNAERVLNTDENENEIPTIRALRAISTIWLVCIFSHVYIMSYIDNTKAIPKMIEKFSFQWINNGSFVSDTLLLLSGFLTAFSYFKFRQSKNRKSTISFWARSFCQGFLKFYVPFFLSMVFLLFIWKYFISGPMWSIYFFNPCSPVQCFKSFWTNFILLNNFLWTWRPCFPLFQLLAVSIQLKVLSYPLLALFSKSSTIGLGLTGLLISISCATQLALTLIYDLPPNMLANVDAFSMHLPMADYFRILFTKPYTRCNAFLIGLVLAWCIFHKSESLSKIASKFCKLLWISAIFACGFLIFGLHGFVMEKSVSLPMLIFQATLGRLIWCLSIALMIFLCETGKGGFIQWTFSHTFWAPMARLTYSAYLVSPFVVLYTYATSESILHLTAYNMLYFCIGCTVLTYFVAFVFHLFFEAPILSLIRPEKREILENGENLKECDSPRRYAPLFPKSKNGDKVVMSNDSEGVALKSAKNLLPPESSRTKLSENA